MKKLFFLILFFSINILTFGANVYFLNDGLGYIYTNGQTFTSDASGRALIHYHLWADPTKYSVSEWGARFQDPDGNWSDWSQLSTSQGLHECLKAGTWHVQGRVWVDYDIYGYSDYYMYTSFTLYFNAVDNYAPSVPQNVSASWQSGHPRITWANNSEYDMGSYIIAKQVDGVSWWMDVATVSAGTTSWSDPYAWPSGKFDPVYTLQYKVKAKDINNNISDYSSVQTVYGNSNLWKSTSIFDKDITDYKLYANYPNPFNPTTQIAYQLLNDGFVKLIVYNTIGQEVAELVNQYQEKGSYTVQFNAVNLPSGIYIYKLQTEGFSDIKKMILAK
ncbi:MAG: T9SS type A sorting domain-containing protein [Ignavibacteriales bacterium]|nr:T9SS type A sorting domain-containing protein [Ignavibacteriales bacterium]